MNLRMALYELAAQHGLDAAGTRRLQEAAGFSFEPPALAHWLPRGLAVLAAALGGFGAVMWVAANWQSLARAAQFGLLMGWVAIACIGALLMPRARAPLGLAALLGIGALFAYFGQTYQTGADAWQLFALWAALALPLCLGARSDVLWAPWALVAMTAISLWTHAHAGHRWWSPAANTAAHAWALLLVGLAVVALSRPLGRFTGAGPWAFRAAVTLAVAMATLSAIGGLFHPRVAPHYAMGLALLAVGAALLSQRRWFDVFALSAVALGLDTLLTAGLVRWLFSGQRGDEIGALFAVGAVAAGLLAGAVSVILNLNKRFADHGTNHVATHG